MTLRTLAFVFLLTALPVTAGGVAVVGTVISDNGDDDGFADTQETVTLRLVVRNTTGMDLSGLTARLTTTDAALACLIQPVIDVGTLASGEERTTDGGFVFAVPPDVERMAITDDLSVRFALSIVGSLPGELATTPWVDLDLDLDVFGGSGPTTYFESFESGFGSFTTMHIDRSLNPPDSDLANRDAGVLNADGTRCQYRNPDLFPESTSGSQGLQCFPNPNGAPDAFYFDIVTDRAFTGSQSLGFNIFLDEPSGYTTPNSQVEAVRTIDPVNLAWDGATPALSFKQQVSFLDHRSVNAQTERTADRGVVAIQLADNGGTATGRWIKAYPYVNVYDSMANSNYFNCSFDPIDDGNDEDDYFDPTDPDRSQGPSSTCAPEFTFAHQGDTDDPFDPENVGDASPGSGIQGALGTGTWVEPVVDLARFRGRRIRIRFLSSGLKLGGAVNWQQAFNHNPDPGDDGWFIDDVTVTDALVTPATVSVDATDNSSLPFDLVDDAEADGVFDVCDNCPIIDNPGQGDRDRDGIGDVCDVCPDDPDDDSDGDGRCVLDDNCPHVPNADQSDLDGDGHGDPCDTCPLDRNVSQALDEDEDGIDCPADNCNRLANPDQADEDLDGVGDACDPCPDDPVNDPDDDGVCFLQDNCPLFANPSQALGIQLANDADDSFILSPDGTILVGRGRLAGNGLFSVPADGGEVVPLSTTFVTQWAITVDSSTVIYRESAGDEGLYTVPIRGGVATRLGQDASDGRVVDFALSPDGTRVVFRAEVGDPASVAVHSAPSQGGPSASLGLPPDPGVDATGVRISEDSLSVLFVWNARELYSVPIGGGVPVLLTPPLSPDRAIASAEFSPEGSRIVYVADQDANNVLELYSVPANGVDAPIKISKFTTTSGASVLPVTHSPTFKISPDGAQVFYTADGETDGKIELFQASIEGGPVRKLNGPLGPGRDILQYEITPDGSSIAFTASVGAPADELFIVSVDQGLAMLLAAPDQGIGRFAFTPDGIRIIYPRRNSALHSNALFAVTVSGGPSELLADEPELQILNRFAISGDGSRVLYQTSDDNRVMNVSVDGTSSVNVGDGFYASNNSPLALSHDGSIAYWTTSDFVDYASWLDPDFDVDGFHAACDCDGDNSAIFPGAPEINDGADNQCPGDAGYGLVDELSGPANFDDMFFYTFTPQDGAIEYEVVRSEDPGFASGCNCRTTSFDTILIPEAPPPGVTFFYLARALTPNLGSAGADSAGNERGGACLTSVCGTVGP